MEWSSLLPPVSWVSIPCHGGWEHHFPGHAVEVALLRGAVWIPLSEVGPLRRCTKTLSQHLLPADWRRLLRVHLEQLPFPAESALWYLAPATALLSDEFSKGRMLSCLMDAWVSLGHFPGAREPTVLRLACQYVLSLRNIAVWPSQPALCAGSDQWPGLMEHGLRLPPLHCCYLGPHDFYRRVFCGTSASLCTVARGPLAYTRAHLARPSPLHVNSVAGELFGLVPACARLMWVCGSWLVITRPTCMSCLT